MTQKPKQFLIQPMVEPADALCQESVCITSLVHFLYSYGDDVSEEKFIKTCKSLRQALHDLSDKAHHLTKRIPLAADD